MDTAASNSAPQRPGLDRRLAFMALGMLCGLIMGLLLWLADLFLGYHHHVVIITLGLMLLEGVIGFVVANGDRNKADDLLSFIIAFFIVP